MTKIYEISPEDLFKHKTNRRMITDVILPSQYHAYSICVEFAKNWFLEKFKDNYFNSVFIDTKRSYDEFRKYSEIHEQLKRTNPLLSISPSINIEHSRDWIDSRPEISYHMRRTRMDGTFFNDFSCCRQRHLQIVFKTILMNFAFRIRLNTRAEELDMIEYIKLHHRAGYTETRNLTMDIHVPREIISQLAYDKDFELDDNLQPKDSITFLNYLNSKSIIPFVYKLRCSNGNNEYFIKVPNCVAHIKTELPSMDDGERDNMISKNYTIDFNIEVEMTAPHYFTYYSDQEHRFLTGNPIIETVVPVTMGVITELPKYDDHGWKLYTNTEYIIDDEDLSTSIDIDFKDFFNGTDLGEIINHSRKIAVSPLAYINFKIYNMGKEIDYKFNSNDMIATVSNLEHPTLVIGLYCDMEYINNAVLYMNELNASRIK